MPPPKKLDLIPEELRAWLAEALRDRGFSDIVPLTDELNDRLAAEGVTITVGKTAVGEFSKALKDQREAFTFAETFLEEFDIEKESSMHRALMQMIGAQAMHLIKASSGEDGQLQAKDLMSLGRMLRDLMSSAGVREKLRDDERARVAREAREAAQAEMAEDMEAAITEAGLSDDQIGKLRRKFLGLRS